MITSCSSGEHAETTHQRMYINTTTGIMMQRKAVCLCIFVARQLTAHFCSINLHRLILCWIFESRLKNDFHTFLQHPAINSAGCLCFTKVQTFHQFSNIICWFEQNRWLTLIITTTMFQHHYHHHRRHYFIAFFPHTPLQWDYILYDAILFYLHKPFDQILCSRIFTKE